MNTQLRAAFDSAQKNFAELEQFLKSKDCCTNIQQTCHNMQQRPYDEFSFAVVGKWSSGKSTFLNNFLFEKTEILPVGRHATTSAIISISHGENTVLRKNTASGIERFKDLASIKAELCSHATDEVTDFDYSLRTSNAILENKVTFIDTPGLDDPDEKRSKLTEAYISAVGGVIFIVKEDETYSSWFYDEFLPEYYDKLSKFFFVINKFDDDDEDIDIDEILENINSAIQNNGSSHQLAKDNIAIINAKTGAGFDDLRAKIANFIYQDKDKEIVEFFKTTYAKCVAEVKNEFNEKISFSDSKIEKHMQNMSRVKRQLDTELKGNVGNRNNCRIKMIACYDNYKKCIDKNCFKPAQAKVKAEFKGFDNTVRPTWNFDDFLEGVQLECAQNLDNLTTDFNQEISKIRRDFMDDIQDTLTEAIAELNLPDDDEAAIYMSLGLGAAGGVLGFAGITAIAGAGTILGTTAFGASTIMASCAGPTISALGIGTAAASSAAIIAWTAGPFAILAPIGFAFFKYRNNKKNADQFLKLLSEDQEKRHQELQQAKVRDLESVEQVFACISNELKSKLMDEANANDFSSEEERKASYTKLSDEFEVLLSKLKKES
ncbi:MAG: dynamin family protein [Akkermansia sp.]